MVSSILSQSAGITLHVENIYGENSHHKIESCFKALARSLKGALEIDKEGKSSPFNKKIVKLNVNNCS